MDQISPIFRKILLQCWLSAKHSLLKGERASLTSEHNLLATYHQYPELYCPQPKSNLDTMSHFGKMIYIGITIDIAFADFAVTCFKNVRFFSVSVESSEFFWRDIFLDYSPRAPIGDQYRHGKNDYNA
jgi:hypothetical protein